MPHFISLMKPGKPGLPDSMTEDDKRQFGQHVAYLKSTFAEGKIVFAGPSTEVGEEHFAIVVLDTSDKSQAVAIVNADPAVASGLLLSHVTEFSIFLERGSS